MDIKTLVKNFILLASLNLIALYQNFQIKIVQNVLGFKFATIIMSLSYLGTFLISTLVLYIKDCQEKQGVGLFKRLWIGFQDQKRISVLSVLFMMNGLCSVYGLYYVSIPIYLAARRCQVFFVILMHVLLCQFKQIKYSMIFAGTVITTATVFAVLGDMNSSPSDSSPKNQQQDSLIGYVFLIAANLGMVFYSELGRRLQNKNKINTTVLLQQETLNSMIIVSTISYFNGELFGSMEFFQNQQSDKNVAVVASIVLYVLSQFGRQMLHLLCTKNMEVFVISLSVNVKDLVGTFASLILFDDINLSNQVRLSLAATFFGAFGYCILKYQESIKNEQSKKPIEDQLLKVESKKSSVKIEDEKKNTELMVKK